MKIRSGFVSNSSSSSFCILGISVNRDKYDEIDAKRWGKDKDTDLSMHRGIDEYYEQYIVGYQPGQMEDTETLAQFKQRAVDALKKFNITVEAKDLDWCVDGGRDS